MRPSSIHETRISLDKQLYSIAVEDWIEESRSGYKRIKSFANPHSFAVIQLLSSLPNNDRDRFLKILPKRSRRYSQEADTTFYAVNEQHLVEAFIGKMCQFSAPYFDGNGAITAMFDKHNALRKRAHPQAVKITRFLSNYLRNACKEWAGYSLIEPEPNMITFERNSLNFCITVNWDLRPWEIFCGLNVHEFKESLINNHTFFGGLGISASPAWYVDEETALEVTTICANHALKVSRIITSILDGLNSTHQRWHGDCK